MRTLTSKQRTKTNTANDHLNAAFCAYGGLGMEALVLIAETAVYGQSSSTWTTANHLIHWTITCLVWGLTGLWLLRQLPACPKDAPGRKQLFFAAVIFAVSIVYTTWSWNGWKPAIEWSGLGPIKFLFQYLYYAFEILLVTLLIAHGQLAFEIRFSGCSRIPSGGILLAATWGLVHIATQGSATGIFTVVQSLLFGSMYLVLRKNYIISWLAITLMFML